MTRIKGSHVLITGGSEGIGLAVAAGALRRGARVSILARNEDKLAVARARLGVDVVTASCDVTRTDELWAAIDAVRARHGDCDIVVSAAGGAEPGHFLELDAETFRRQIDLNYLGVVDTIRAVLPSMVRRGRGHLVVVSSVAGLFGVLGYGAYAPTKFAVRGLAETLDAEFRHRGVRVSIAYPPDTRTPGFERENQTKPEETQRISAGIAAVSPDQVATAILEGIRRNRFLITVDPQTAAIARITDLAGPILRTIMRRHVQG